MGIENSLIGLFGVINARYVKFFNTRKRRIKYFQIESNQANSIINTVRDTHIDIYMCINKCSFIYFYFFIFFYNLISNLQTLSNLLFVSTTSLLSSDSIYILLHGVWRDK